MNPVNSFTFPSNKTATQSHSQANMLFWLDFLCDNLVYPCNTPPVSMVPVSSSRIVTAQRPGTEAMISDIHRQSNVGTPTTARATTPPSGYEECAPVEMGMFTTGGAKEPARSCPRRSEHR